MKRRQIKRDRPNLGTAHEFHKDGGFLIDPARHFTSEKEREDQIVAITDDLESLAKRFPKTQNIEYALLKAHLIIEHLIVQYIRGYSTTQVTFKDIKGGFAQKLEIAIILGFGMNDPIILPTVEGLNRLRNQIAHTFELDRSKLDEILRVNSEDYHDFNVSSDRQRVAHLRRICRYLCARIAGEMLGTYVATMHFEKAVLSEDHDR